MPPEKSRVRAAGRQRSQKQNIAQQNPICKDSASFGFRADDRSLFSFAAQTFELERHAAELLDHWAT